jgi:hypothetical protein
MSWDLPHQLVRKTILPKIGLSMTHFEKRDEAIAKTVGE